MSSMAKGNAAEAQKHHHCSGLQVEHHANIVHRGPLERISVGPGASPAMGHLED